MLEWILMIVLVGICTGAGLFFVLLAMDKLLEPGGAPERQHDGDRWRRRQRKA